MHWRRPFVRTSAGQNVLGIYVRRGGQPAEARAGGHAAQIGDTLGVLGLGELRQLVIEKPADSRPWPRARRRRIRSAGAHRRNALINVEDRLDRDLIGLIVPKTQAKSGRIRRRRIQQVQSAVLRECSINTVRVKGDASVSPRHAGCRRTRFTAGLSPASRPGC
jgi:chemosensory pili system protein ChpA (sensor histidine kinase/response regulator)